MNGKYKSIKQILNKVLRNPMMKGVNETDLAQDVGDCLKLIGAYDSFEDLSCDIVITDYKGTLPSDLLFIVQTLWQGDTKGPEGNFNYYPMRYASSTLHSKYHEIGSPDFNQLSEVTYSVNNGFIFTNEKTGNLKVIYKGIPIDADGFPKIPDNIKFEKAIEAYLKMQHYTVLWELGKLPDKVMQRAEQEYSWYVGAAQTAGQLMTIDEAESWSNAFSKLLLEPLQHQESFVNQGAQQYLTNI